MPDPTTTTTPTTPVPKPTFPTPEHFVVPYDPTLPLLPAARAAFALELIDAKRRALHLLIHLAEQTSDDNICRLAATTVLKATLDSALETDDLTPPAPPHYPPPRRPTPPEPPLRHPADDPKYKDNKQNKWAGYIFEDDDDPLPPTPKAQVPDLVPVRVPGYAASAKPAPDPTPPLTQVPITPASAPTPAHSPFPVSPYPISPIPTPLPTLPTPASSPPQSSSELSEPPS